MNDFQKLTKQNQILTLIILLNLSIHSLSHLNMSVLNSFLTLIQKTLIALVFIPAAIKISVFIHNFIYTINHLRDALNTAEHQIRLLQNTIEDLRYQVEDNQRVIHEQMTATADMQQQLVEQSIDTVSATKDIGDIYECLDLLDDRLLEFARTHKTKKQLRREKKEIEMVDQRNPTEECFDEFIADCLVYDPSERIGKNELIKLFRVWCDKTHQKMNTTEIELEGYMIRNFGPPEESEDQQQHHHKVSRKENKRDSSWTGLKSKSK